MVEAQRIVDEAAAWGADAIYLSGLITPSLDEMIHVVEEAERRSLHIPSSSETLPPTSTRP